MPEARWDVRGEEFRLATCETCGGIFTTPEPSASLLHWLYTEHFNYRWYRHHYPAKFLDCLERLGEYRRRGFLRGKSILEYGGGLGYMARAARLLGRSCESWDPYAGSNPRPARTWDHVFCHHTLEHAPRPAEMLADVRSCLGPEAPLVLAVPNAQGRGYRERGLEWVWFQPPVVHLHHFTREGLVRLLERTGFRVAAVDFRDRWDASGLADVHAGGIFRLLDHSWGKSPLPALTCQVTSALRLLALWAGRAAEAGRRPEDRAELVVVARAR